MENMNINEAEESIPSLAENSEVIFLPAGFWIRFLAAFIDGIFLGIILYPLNFLYQLSLAYISDNNTIIFLSILYQVIYMVIFGLIAAAFIAKKGGLPGKLLLGLKIVDYETGTFISGLRAFTREVFAKTLSLILLCIGHLMIGVSSDKRGLHDHICRTMVVKRTKSNTE